MSIEWFRDLIISILGIVAIGALIFIAVILYSFYRRTRPIVDSINTITKALAVQEISRLSIIILLYNIITPDKISRPNRSVPKGCSGLGGALDKPATNQSC